MKRIAFRQNIRFIFISQNVIMWKLKPSIDFNTWPWITEQKIVHLQICVKLLSSHLLEWQKTGHDLNVLQKFLVYKLWKNLNIRNKKINSKYIDEYKSNFQSIKACMVYLICIKMNKWINEYCIKMNIQYIETALIYKLKKISQSRYKKLLTVIDFTSMY